MIKAWIAVAAGLLGVAYILNTLVMGGPTKANKEGVEVSTVDDRIFTQIFICEDRAGRGRETQIAEILSGVFLSQGKEMLVDVMNSNGYDQYCSLAVSPFAAAAMADQQVIGSATGGFGPNNGNTLYLVRGSSNMVFAVSTGKW